MDRREALLLAACAASSGLLGCVNLFKPTKGAYLSVDQGRCSGCRRCIAVCNADAITIMANKALIDPTKCTKCSKCLDVCPYDAIS